MKEENVAQRKKSFGDIVAEALNEVIPAAESLAEDAVDAILDGLEEASRVLDEAVEKGIDAVDDLITYGERGLEEVCGQLTDEWLAEQAAKPKKPIDEEREFSNDPQKAARQISAQRRQAQRAARSPEEQLEIVRERVKDKEKEIGGYAGREVSKLTRQIKADLEASQRRVAVRAQKAAATSKQQASIEVKNARKAVLKADKNSNQKPKGSKKGKPSGNPKEAKSDTKKGVK